MQAFLSSIDSYIIKSLSKYQQMRADLNGQHMNMVAHCDLATHIYINELGHDWFG